MRHTIELSEAGEAALRRIAVSTGRDEDLVLGAMVEATLTEGSRDLAATRSASNVMGGDVCIRDTRIPVWMLVGYKEAGYADERILQNFPGLHAADLIAAWDYNAAHEERIRAERRAHEEAE